MVQKLATASLLMASGVVIGILTTLLVQARNELSRKGQSEDEDHTETRSQGGREQVDEDENCTTNNNNDTYEDIGHLKCPQNLRDSKLKRDRLPSLIILVRHGESEGNADDTLYRTKPDNLVELTERGVKQAHRAGKRVERLFYKLDLQAHAQRQSHGEGTSQSTTGTHSAFIRRLHLVISPFERTRQTAAAMRPWFAHRVVRTEIEPRIREQEFGNLQGHDFADFRAEQRRVGRFWYRFPTGESGSDVYDRVKSWWTDSILNVNERYGYEPVDAMVVVTHGLTMRFVLMQLFGWSPMTFHSVWNADNCNLYVLRKDLSKPGPSPYVLDEEAGDMPKSSIDLKVEFDNSRRKVFKFHDYLKIPPPRTQQLDLVKLKLEEQYPDIDKEHITSVMFLPFIDGAVTEERTRTGRRASLGILEMMTLRSPGPESRDEHHRREQRLHHADSGSFLDGFCKNPELYAEPEMSWQF